METVSGPRPTHYLTAAVVVLAVIVSVASEAARVYAVFVEVRLARRR